MGLQMGYYSPAKGQPNLKLKKIFKTLNLFQQEKSTISTIEICFNSKITQFQQYKSTISPKLYAQIPIKTTKKVKTDYHA